MFLVDSHCHLEKLNYQHIHKDLNDVIKKADKCNVKFFLSVSTCLSSYKKIKNLIGINENIAYTCGIHPLFCEKNYNLNELNILSSDPKVVAIGETGLDYYNTHIERNKKFQKKLFREHIRIAKVLKKPIVLHTRHASIDTLGILHEEKADSCNGVLHCCTENKKVIEKILNLGFYISFSGILTFSNAHIVKETARFVPLDRILVETDSPYLAPVPYRGKENQPAWILEIIKCLSLIKNIDIHSLAKHTTKNFFDLFKIQLPKHME